MKILAGIDIGNSTTEVLFARADGGEVTPLFTARARTAGEKGSRESLMGAAQLLLGAEKRWGLRCEEVAIAELHPVRTFTAELPRLPATGVPLTRLTAAGASTPSGSGLAVGVHYPVQSLRGHPVGDDDVIVSVPRDVHFKQASATLTSALSRGWPIVGIVVAADESVLIGNRLAISIPIVDETCVNDLAQGSRIALEVAEPGESVKVLNDPVALMALFALPASSLETIAAFARSLSDARATAITACDSRSRGEEPRDGGLIEFVRGGQTVKLPLLGSPNDALRRIPPGSVRILQAPFGSDLEEAIAGDKGRIRDFFLSDLPGLEERCSVRSGSVRLDAAPVSVHIEHGKDARQEAVIGETTGRPVSVISSESRAARLGALTTPAAPSDAAICDIGGGTIDVAGVDGAVVAAGAGELLTVSVAFALGLTRGLAEYVKRSASVRVESPYLVHHEDGSRDFLGRPASGAAVGRLCLRRRGTLVPFTDALSPEEWRVLRLSIKAQVIVANISRCLDHLNESPRAILLCGGAASDKELVRIVGDWLAARGAMAGRANVGGRFGPRYAVALGLALLLAQRQCAASGGQNNGKADSHG
jgi:hypothetical protein